MNKKILLQPIGEVSESVIRVLEESLPQHYSTNFETGEALELPEDIRDDSREQYNSPEMISWVERKSDIENYYKILGICDVDAFREQFNFVFGEAQKDGKIGMVYLSRLRGSSDQSNNEEIFLKRVAKVGVHELGHTFGLEHCRRPSCVMRFSNSLSETDSKESKMCGVCSTWVQRIIQSSEF